MKDHPLIQTQLNLNSTRLNLMQSDTIDQGADNPNDNHENRNKKENIKDMTTPIQQRLQQLEQRPARQCAVPGCVENARRFGSYCARHDRLRQSTGDAQGHTIKWKMLKPYFDLALSHIEEAERIESNGLPPVTYKPIIPVIEGLRQAFESATRSKPRLLVRDQRRQRERVAFWLSKMHENELDPRRFMAVVVGMALMRMQEPEQFVTDLHWWYQTTLRIVRLLPGPAYTGVSRDRASTPTVRIGHVRVFGKWFLRNRFGMYCGIMAEDIAKRLEAQEEFEAGPMAGVV